MTNKFYSTNGTNLFSVSACVKTLAVDKDEDPLIEFYKARVNYFYSGSVEEVEFDQLDSNMRSVINQMVTMKTREKVQDFMYHDHLPKYLPPMISFGANFLQVICHTTSDGLQLELSFWSFRFFGTIPNNKWRNTLKNANLYRIFF